MNLTDYINNIVYIGKLYETDKSQELVNRILGLTSRSNSCRL